MRAVILCLAATSIHSQTFIGSQACAPCHPSEFKRHAASMHERALRPASASHATALFDRPVRERSGIEFSYAVTPKGLSVKATVGGQSTTAMLEWIFGAGAFAFTPVGRFEGTTNPIYFEHRVSWYSASQRPGMTLGHPTHPRSPLGEAQAASTIFRCFHCHATGVKPGPDLTHMQPGVQCERCHGPAAAHVAAPTTRNIVTMTKRSARATVAACADCHRMLDETAPHSVTPERADPMSIRFAPVGLMASKCFQASGRLSCITCHDPHGGPRLEPVSYENKCRGCHTGASRVVSNCPRQKDTSCLGCHMKKATPVSDLTFTDHRIRVFDAVPRN